MDIIIWLFNYFNIIVNIVNIVNIMNIGDLGWAEHKDKQRKGFVYVLRLRCTSTPNFPQRRTARRVCTL